MSKNNNTLLIVAGPTAVGKTDLCINLAKKFNTFIVSADSRQFFQEMEIGTAKPRPDDRIQIKHFFINNISIKDDYNVGKFEAEAVALLEELFKTRRLVILTGGSGLYLDAVAGTLDDIPKVDPSIREELMESYRQHGIEALSDRLLLLDPVYHAQADLRNPHRVVRALEVCLGTGKPFSSFRNQKKKGRPFRILKIALARDRQELYERIEARMDQMIAEGLFEEARNLYPWRALNALQTVGYQEIFDYIDQKYDYQEAVRLLKRNSRRYAKRQMTWLRKDQDYHWFHPSQYPDIVALIENHMAE